MGATDRLHLEKTILLKEGEVWVVLIIYIGTYLEMLYYILPTSLPSADNQSPVVWKLQLESVYLMFHGTLFIFVVVVIVELMLVPGKGLSDHPGSPPVFCLETQHIRLLVRVDQGSPTT